MRVALTLFVLLAIGSCRRTPAPPLPSPVPLTNASKTTTDAFPIVRLTYPHTSKDVEMLADYGYIIDWPSDRPPVFYVFDKTRRARVRLATWDAFTAAMGKLPNGSDVDEVSKCTVAFAYGMPEEKRVELNALLAKKSLKIISYEDHQRHTDFCYCEARMAVLADADR